MATDTQYCTFVVDGLFLGIDVLRVQEVIRSLPMTRVPLAPPAIEGLINLRGQLVTAIDLRTSLGLAPRPRGLDPMNVIIRTDEGPISLVVDEIGDVIETDESTFEPAPETLEAVHRAFIKGVYKLPNRVLLVLDTAAALTSTATTAHP